MFKLFTVSLALSSAIFGSALAQTCPALSYPLTNGTTADGSQVIYDINQVRNCAVNTSGGTLTGGTLAGTTSLPGSGVITSAGNIGLGNSAPVGSIYLKTTQVPSGGYAYGLIAQDNVSSTVTGDFRSIYANGSLNSGSYTVNNTMGLYIGDMIKGSGVTLNNDFGIYITPIVNGTTNYAIYSSGGTNYFAGNVGIGYASPNGLLDVRASSTDHLLIRGHLNLSTGASIYGVNDSNSTYEGLEFASSVTDFSTGYVGIGTATPGYSLTVNGTAYAAGAAGALSDIRHKDKVTTLQPGALNIVEKLRPVTFAWKDPKDDGMKGEQIGFIAQEVQKVLPSVVLTDKDKDKTLGIKYTEIIPVLAKAIQEQQAEIESLKSELAALKTAH